MRGGLRDQCGTYYGTQGLDISAESSVVLLIHFKKSGWTTSDNFDSRSVFIYFTKSGRTASAIL